MVKPRLELREEQWKGWEMEWPQLWVLPSTGSAQVSGPHQDTSGLHLGTHQPPRSHNNFRGCRFTILEQVSELRGTEGKGPWQGGELESWLF